MNYRSATPTFVVAEEEGETIAVGGLENYQTIALLRSFAVRREKQGQGIGRGLFNLLKETASTTGVKEFYLLTTTAEDYFLRLGFERCDKSNAPHCIRHTKQFTDLCPSTARMLVLELQPQQPIANNQCE